MAVASEHLAGDDIQRFKLVLGAPGVDGGNVSAVNPLPISGTVSISGAAVTVADGADVAQGATTDAESTGANGTVVGLLKRLRTLLGGTLNVAGTFWQATQPVSAASLPLPAGAAQDGTDGATPPAIPGTGIRGWLRAIYDRLASVPVTGTFWQTVQPVSATSLPLPTSAATEATLATVAKDSTVAKDATVAARLADATFTGRINTQGQKNMIGSTPVVLASDQSAVPVSQMDVTATGSVAALNAVVTLATGGAGMLGIQITGTWVGTVAFECTVDGTNWQAAWVESVVSQSIVQTVSANDVIKAQGGGYTSFRARMSAWTSGSATVTLRGSQSGGPRRVWVARANAAAPTYVEGQPTLLSTDLAGNTRVAQGAAGAAGWPTVVGITDSVMASGTAATPLAGAAIATIAAPGAGTYEIQATSFVTGAQGTQANMQLQHAAVVVGSLQSVLNQPVAQRCRRVTVAAGEAITINAIAADATVGVVYAASIVATRVA